MYFMWLGNIFILLTFCITKNNACHLRKKYITETVPCDFNAIRIRRFMWNMEIIFILICDTPRMSVRLNEPSGLFVRVHFPIPQPPPSTSISKHRQPLEFCFLSYPATESRNRASSQRPPASRPATLPLFSNGTIRGQRCRFSSNPNHVVMPSGAGCYETAEMNPACFSESLRYGGCRHRGGVVTFVGFPPSHVLQVNVGEGRRINWHIHVGIACIRGWGMIRRGGFFVYSVWGGA